jgi:exopolysaccharide biosynthesis predicted pyruvyltransferase EpsI
MIGKEVAGAIKNEVHLTSKGGGNLGEIFQHCQY